VADGVCRDEDVGDGVGVRAAEVLGELVDVEDSVLMAVTELVIAAVNEPVNVALPNTADEIVALLVAEGEGDDERLRMLAMLRPRKVMLDTAASASPASHSVDRSTPLA
jgi:hypothetical protein